MPHIIQFGTSRFLQAHVDLFAWEAAEHGQAVPPIVVVQTSGDPARAERIAAFGRPEGHPVVVCGLDGTGQRIDRTVMVRSIAHGLAAARDWAALCDLFVEGGDYVVSNTGDAGYRIDDADRVPATLVGDVAPRSFPAMLLALLHRRWRSGAAGVTLLPCELVRRNADVLKRVVGDLARSLDADADFLCWLDEACRWVNTLVDRIVSEPIEPVGAVAEPYALWAIETQPGLVMPFAHPDVVLTDDLDRYERLKLHILNLGHTWLAERWIDAGRPDGMTVRRAMADARLRDPLDRMFAEEVLPGFAAHGLGAAAADYLRQTVTRFANPFLDHEIADIAGSHEQKLEKRVGAFVDWVREVEGAPAMPELAALAGRPAAATR